MRRPAKAFVQNKIKLSNESVYAVLAEYGQTIDNRIKHSRGSLPCLRSNTDRGKNCTRADCQGDAGGARRLLTPMVKTRREARRIGRLGAGCRKTFSDPAAAVEQRRAAGRRSGQARRAKLAAIAAELRSVKERI